LIAWATKANPMFADYVSQSVGSQALPLSQTTGIFHV